MITAGDVKALCDGAGVACKMYDQRFIPVSQSTSRRYARARQLFRELYAGRVHDSSFEWDCDDYAFLFKAACSLNAISCAIALVYMTSSQAGIRLGHMCNAVIYDVSGRPMLFLVEPQNILYRVQDHFPLTSKHVNALFIDSWRTYEIAELWW